MRAPAWLTAQPVAHRGLHDRSTGVIENLPSAFEAAARAGFAIETDLQLTADGEAMAFHDDTLDRLTLDTGPVLARSADELRRVAFRETSDRMISLPELCSLVNGRVPLVLEIKSHFQKDRQLIARVIEVLDTYRHPVAVMSFDPDQIIALRERAPHIVRGIVAQRTYDGDPEWDVLPKVTRDGMLGLRHAFRTQPHFVAYWVNQLPAPAPWIARNIFGCALLTWTVRTPEQRAIARRHADQMIFEGFMPEPATV